MEITTAIPNILSTAKPTVYVRIVFDLFSMPYCHFGNTIFDDFHYRVCFNREVCRGDTRFG